ncbi:MAG: M42 family metallopeptidase [Peptococcaceae bacterium]|nr:M42 family metallopeptidase [Peptococcaceae bacterium]
MNSYDLAKKVIFSLSDEAGVSGYEHPLFPALQGIFTSLASETRRDFIGNFYAVKKGLDGKSGIMLAAHMDEIGLILTHIDDRGFFHFSAVGGIDDRTLLYQEVIVHGQEDIRGIICSVPSRVHQEVQSKKSIDMTQLVIDVGYPRETVMNLVKPGDIISLIRKPFSILNDKIVAKALDDRAGIAVLAICLNELGRLSHRHNVYAVATVQEEVGLRGAITSSDGLQPDLAVAIDVTHAQTLDTKNQVSIQLGKGPAITVGPNIHPRIFTDLTRCAKESRIPYQIQPIAGETGTDARVIQLTGYGIPTGLISIPLRYMHTSVETASLQDIVDSGKLLADFIAGLPENLEELLCC